MDRLSTKGQMIDQIDLHGVPHSGFDRSNHNYGTGKLGTLITTRLDEVYPGDRIKGKPEMVVNFEPLAAPLMGSMVLKQESFFVPYIQLWRHAYKFFTGKNGFNEPMPTVTPKKIFQVWNGVLEKLIMSIGQPENFRVGLGVLVYHLSQYYDQYDISRTNTYSIVNGRTFKEDFEYVVLRNFDNFAAINFGPRKMRDLIEPAIKPFWDFYESSEMTEYSLMFEGSSHDAIKILPIAGLLGSLARQMFDYIHGPSSLFDYLGWPVPTDFKIYPDGSSKPITIPEYGVYDIFQYAIYRNILIDRSYVLNDVVMGLFSEVPLVFNPFKAYYLVWYWNYRDQLLETDILDPEDDEFLGSTITDNVIIYCTINRQRCWFKDTYTTALTNTGSGNLLVPTGSVSSDVEFKYYNSDGQLLNTTDYAEAFNAGATVFEVTNEGITYKLPMNYLGGSNSALSGFIDDQTSNFISLDLFDRIKRLRSYVQKRLILGYEVDDVIWSSFMVKLTNVRMHIPEILGRGRDLVQINTVVNNTTTAEQIAGDKTATAWAHGQQSDMDYFSEEWGLFLTICTIMPVQCYAGGLQRLYLKKDPLDYAWPEFATMGMDAVYNTELAALGTRLTDEQGLMVFGYQGRYYDLKSRQDEEHGRLLTDLNYLTFSREWDKNNPPVLNYIFVHCWPRLDGFVVESPLMDVFRYDCYNAHAWERRLPVPSEIVG